MRQSSAAAERWRQAAAVRVQQRAAEYARRRWSAPPPRRYAISVGCHAMMLRHADVDVMPLSDAMKICAFAIFYAVLSFACALLPFDTPPDAATRHLFSSLLIAVFATIFASPLRRSDFLLLSLLMLFASHGTVTRFTPFSRLYAAYVFIFA